MNLRRAFLNKNTWSFWRSSSGLTLIELMIVLIVVAVLATMGIVGYRNWQQHILLTNATDELKSALSLAQQQAVSAAKNSNWGIHLEADTYVIFSGSFYDSNNPDNQSRNFHGVQVINLDTAISDGAGGYTPNIVFTKYTGQTPNIGSLTLAPNSLLSHTRTINITANGQVD